MKDIYFVGFLEVSSNPKYVSFNGGYKEFKTIKDARCCYNNKPNGVFAHNVIILGKHNKNASPSVIILECKPAE